MEFISMKCPQCNGDLDVIGSGYAKCQFCGSMFYIEGQGTPSAAGNGFIEDTLAPTITKYPSVGHYGEGFDPEKFFKALASTQMSKKASDFFLGDTLKDSHIERATRFFEIQPGEVVYLGLDTTLFNSFKVGLACCTTGIYMKDEAGDVGYLSWDDFKRLPYGKVYLDDDDNLMIGDSKFIVVGDDPKLLNEMFREIWNRLQ